MISKASLETLRPCSFSAFIFSVLFTLSRARKKRSNSATSVRISSLVRPRSTSIASSSASIVRVLFVLSPAFSSASFNLLFILSILLPIRLSHIDSMVLCSWNKAFTTRGSRSSINPCCISSSVKFKFNLPESGSYS